MAPLLTYAWVPISIAKSILASRLPQSLFTSTCYRVIFSSYTRIYSINYEGIIFNLFVCMCEHVCMLIGALVHACVQVHKHVHVKAQRSINLRHSSSGQLPILVLRQGLFSGVWNSPIRLSWPQGSSCPDLPSTGIQACTFIPNFLC